MIKIYNRYTNELIFQSQVGEFMTPRQKHHVREVLKISELNEELRHKLCDNFQAYEVIEHQIIKQNRLAAESGFLNNTYHGE